MTGRRSKARTHGLRGKQQKGPDPDRCLASEQFRAPDQQRPAKQDAIDGEDGEAVLADPEKEPLDHPEGDDKRDGEPDKENDPTIGGHNDVRRGHSGGLRGFAGVNLLE